MFRYFLCAVVSLFALAGCQSKQMYDWEVAGDAAMINGKFAEARDLYSKIIAQDSNFAPAFPKRARAYAALYDFASALKDCRRYQRFGAETQAKLGPLLCQEWVVMDSIVRNELDPSIAQIEQTPRDANAFARRAAVHSKIGNYKETIADLTKAIELAPKADSLYKLRGAAYLIDENLREAVKDFEYALKFDSTDTELFMQVADVQQQSGQLQKALDNLNKAIKANPDLHQAYQVKAETYYKMKKPREADQALTDYLKRRPQDSEMLIARGALRQKMGYKDKACADFRAAKKMGNLDADNYIPQACFN